MELNEFYKLRTDFTVIGLTGRVGSGCSEIATILCDNEFANNSYKNFEFSKNRNEDEKDPERIKFGICIDYLKNNWTSFKKINYKNVLIFHLIQEANSTDNPIDWIIKVICQNSPEIKSEYTNRFGKTDDNQFIQQLSSFLTENEPLLEKQREIFGNSGRFDRKQDDFIDNLKTFFFGEDFEPFCDKLFQEMNQYDITKRTRFTHDIANNLRAFGTVYETERVKESLDNIYTIAETINSLIKAWRRYKKDEPCKIIVDALKNSLELMYFKEKYSGFYMLATNRNETARKKHLLSVTEHLFTDQEIEKKHIDEIIRLDSAEYKGDDYKKGQFSSPDIENCIQKSDYHIYIPDENEFSDYIPFQDQLVRLVSLIHKPGLVTPTAIERSMQMAYNAKFNSGCISRQVGAVITDNRFSVKSIGWNDVPQSQIPCNLRDIRNLSEKKTLSYFSEYENNGGEYDAEKELFVDKVKQEINKSGRSFNDLKGRSCPFCFKSFHNAFEGKDNQVHTRSLHAEENAMMQITKYGGQPLEGGYLFTTASPCELCSKKAFQLGIVNVYYIDPYPGISQTQILKAGKDADKNPKLFMFQGAVGRAFHKLYEPFMPLKDEIFILTGINPQQSVESRIRKMFSDENVKDKIIDKLKDFDEDEKMKEFEKIIGKLFID